MATHAVPHRDERALIMETLRAIARLNPLALHNDPRLSPPSHDHDAFFWAPLRQLSKGIGFAEPEEIVIDEAIRAELCGEFVDGGGLWIDLPLSFKNDTQELVHIQLQVNREREPTRVLIVGYSY